MALLLAGAGFLREYLDKCVVDTEIVCVCEIEDLKIEDTGCVQRCKLMYKPVQSDEAC